MRNNNYLIIFKPIVFTFVYLICALGLQVLFYFIISRIDIKYYEYCVPLSLLLILPFVYVLYRKKYAEKSTFKTKYFIYTAISAIVYYVILFLSQSEHNSIVEHVLYREIFYIITFLILYPIIEEIFFRGILLKMLANDIPLILNIIIVSLLFASIHIFSIRGLDFSIMYLSQFFIFIIISSFIYIKTKNIYCSILFHFVYNLCWYLFRFI
ncbi:MAG: lysostaphin resistance A-like protein [Dysgonomonas sp.]